MSTQKETQEETFSIQKKIIRVCNCEAFKANNGILFDSQDLREQDRRHCPMCEKPFPHSTIGNDKKFEKGLVQDATKLAYETQKERIEISNELTREFRKRRNIPSWKTKDPIYGVEEDPKSMETLVLAHKGGQEPGKIIQSQEEDLKVQKYINTLQRENLQMEEILELVKNTPIYKSFLGPNQGIPNGIIGILLGWFDIQKANFPSSFWSYAGLQPPKSKKPQNVRSFQDIPKDNEGTHNPFIKAKLTSELGHALLNGSKTWKKIYEDYYKKIQSDPSKEIKSKAHLHNMCMRYMLKEFLKELHVKWREAENLPTTKPYQKS